MRLKYFFQFSLLLLAVELAAAAAQTPPCSTLSSDEALFARATGACRDLAPIVDKASKGAAIVEKGSRAGRTAAPSTRQGEIPRSAAQSEAPSGRAAPAPVQQLHVPNVTGIPINAAQARLGRFKVERRERYSPAPVGQVIEQAPKASTRAAAGSAIVLTVSVGPAIAETFELPNVVDRTDAAAGNTLAEFRVQRVVVPSAAPSGTVLAQHPDPGSAVSPGAIVTLHVSDGSLAAASTLSEPAPASSTTAPAANDRRPVALSGLIIGAASLLALVIIGMLIRRWLRARAIEPQIASADASFTPTAIAVTADDFRFAAHLDAGEVRVEFAGPANRQETSDEYSSAHHA